MLAGITFSLAAAVQAFAAAANAATPRATRLLQEDGTTQNVLARFVGAFLFSLVGVMALHAGVHGEKGRVILFATTIIVVVLVVGTLLRRIDHVMRFGRIGYTLDRVEKAAIEAVGCEIRVACLPGKFANPAQPLLGVSGAALSDATTSHSRSPFTVESARNFPQDPRFGLLVLSEIASRALSPSINNQGTAPVSDVDNARVAGAATPYRQS